MKYPLGIQTFSEIREENYAYVDKTALIHTLISSGKAYFLSRPRRFGKSLLVSTLSALFSGHKSLFLDLTIATTQYDFARYPVINMEFSKVQVETPQDLKNYIDTVIDRYCKEYQLSVCNGNYELRFDDLVRQLHQSSGSKVVLLVDEYDKPILANLSKPELTSVKSVLSTFYGVVKSLDEHLKFVFITGVSKFAKVSVFSGMNNLTDISQDRRFATICGLTQVELEGHFAGAIGELAAVQNVDRPTLLQQIKHWYNGYKFHYQGAGIYNPYSILSLFQFQEFRNYWYATATPTFLLDLLDKQQFELARLAQFEIGSNAFVATEPEDMDLLSLLLQTGYLTIKSYTDPLYVLDFPNYEVKKSFYDSIVGRYSHLSSGLEQTYVYKLQQYLNTNDLAAFFSTLQQFFANIPYDLTLDREKYYQSLFYAIFTLLGLSIEAEVRTNNGRIDCVLQTEQSVYIIEFKLNDSKEAALQQIMDKQYAQKYQDCGKKVVLVGVEFDKAMRNIAGYLVG